jgi:hypothetical protein
MGTARCVNENADPGVRWLRGGRASRGLCSLPSSAGSRTCLGDNDVGSVRRILRAGFEGDGRLGGDCGAV